MPSNRTSEHRSALRFAPRTRGPIGKRCRTCDALFPVGALTFGQCPDCAGLVALPLRGADGRFLPTARPALADLHNKLADGGARR